MLGWQALQPLQLQLHQAPFNSQPAARPVRQAAHPAHRYFLLQSALRCLPPLLPPQPHCPSAPPPLLRLQCLLLPTQAQQAHKASTLGPLQHLLLLCPVIASFLVVQRSSCLVSFVCSVSFVTCSLNGLHYERPASPAAVAWHSQGLISALQAIE